MGKLTSLMEKITKCEIETMVILVTGGVNIGVEGYV